MDQCRRLHGNRRDLVLTASALDATTGADALFILTESHIFRAPDLDDLRERMKNPPSLGGRNLFEPRAMAQAGFGYFSVGRAAVLPPEAKPGGSAGATTMAALPDAERTAAAQPRPEVALDAPAS